MALPQQPGQGQGGAGMLAQAAAAASQVPDPAAPPPQQQPTTGDAVGQPGAQQTQPPNSPIPGPHVETMPETGQAYHPEADAAVKTEEATDSEEREYRRVSGALDKVLYEEDKLVDSIMQQLDPNDKIGSTTKATALLIQQLDERVDMDEIVVPQITMDAVDAVSELAENRFNMQFSEQDLQATLGATWESVMAMFGVSKEELSRFMEGYKGQGNALKKAYNGFLNQGNPSRNDTPAPIPSQQQMSQQAPVAPTAPVPAAPSPGVQV